MSAARGAVCALLLLLAPVACKKAEPARPSQRATSASTSAAPQPDASTLASAPAPPARHMRVSALQGALHANGQLLAVDAELAADTRLELARGDTITLSLQDYVRLQIVGPALVQLLPDGLPALLMRQGLLTLDLAPRGMRSTESAFWLATPSLRFDVPDSVRVAVRAFPESATELAVVSGYLTVSQAQKTLAVPAASSVCITLDEAKVLPLRIATLELALRSLGAAKSCAPGARIDDALLESTSQHAADYVQQVSAREQEQLVLHTRAVAENPAHAAELREGLAHLGAELVPLRERARALSAQRAARALSAAH